MGFKNNNYPALDKLLRLKDVLELIPVSKTTWYKGIKEGKFPELKKIGERVSVWLASDLYKCIDFISNKKT